jgi:hypothetical protein
MAGNWLASAELPAKFWFYAVKRAAENGVLHLGKF